MAAMGIQTTIMLKRERKKKKEAKSLEEYFLIPTKFSKKLILTAIYFAHPPKNTPSPLSTNSIIFK